MLKLLAATYAVATAAAFNHPGLLHTADDLARVQDKVNNAEEPWITAWELLTANSHAQLTYQARPQTAVYRGSDGVHSENYPILYNDAHAAYQLAIRWWVGGDSAYADASINILNGWASTLQVLGGSSDVALAAGIYGYQLANAAELMRSYSGWDAADQAVLKTMLLNVFYYENHRFLVDHNGQDEYHYWANWDLCNTASMMAIAVYSDNQTMYDEAKNWFLNGPGRGSIIGLIYKNYTEEGSGKQISQGQEAGRDQGHATLDFTLLGVNMQQGYNQGDDFFATNTNVGLAGAEYVSKYNTGHDVPYTLYESYLGTEAVISNSSRGINRPGYELLVAHYADIKGLNASWTALYRDQVNANSPSGVEGGGGNYASTSGGYDDLGYGTLLYRLTA
ncbi:hypothetical protein ONZ43_g1703 [Nemania bipapillata]|uniref:Uncharacterized protein n=1 Tax=Nemania bipapillata TaxID=110536 RepID=A0ACC2J3L1_9PEZI|nr:hypothetical protein ONZ43_g1703 [Nemania bipapillata]